MENALPTASVFVRHSTNCKDAAKGESWRRCTCRKSIRVYHPASKTQEKFSAKTRSWEQAEKVAQNYLDSFDPIKRELKTLKAEKESKTCRIEEAVARFLASKVTENIQESTVNRYRTLLGNVALNPVSIERNGHLFEWLDKQIQKPIFVSDLTVTNIEDFMADWGFNDQTANLAFGHLKQFLTYCRLHGWTDKNLMEGKKRPKVKQGSRTTAFSDEQYSRIIKTIKARDEVDGIPNPILNPDVQRLLAFVELMRWGGLALTDAIHFKKDSLKGNGELRYRRQKTDRWARPTLPQSVTVLLKNVPPVDDDLNQPFRDQAVKPESDRNWWYMELRQLFADAGIEVVTTDIRDRDPHGHMFRDTFVIGQLRMQAKLGIMDYKSIAEAIGDTVATMLKHYAPWVNELEEAHKETQRKIVEAQVREQEEKERAKITAIRSAR